MSDMLQKLDVWRKWLLGAGIGFLLISLLGLFLSPATAYISYLASFIFWFGLALGCLNLAMIHHLAGGAWGNVTRRIFEAGYMTLPLMAVLFVPVLPGVHELYPWANPATVAGDPILQQKSAYENFPAFTLRAVVYFAVCIQIAFLLRRWSLRQDLALNRECSLKAKTLSGPGIVVVPFVATFAYVDWIMSAEPAWFSTIFGIILLAAGILTALSLAIVLLAWLQPRFSPVANRRHFLDLGNLLLAFVMFWTYVSFSQLLIIYSGNQPHEIAWYLHRIAGGWKWLLVFIALFHFFVPFLILLSRNLKEDIRALAWVAGVVFCVDAGQIFWTIAPSYYPNGIQIHWTDFTAWLGFGGIWLGIFCGNFRRHPMLIHDLPESQTVSSKASSEK